MAAIEASTQQTTCVVVVDPVSTGGSVALECATRGHEVVALWTADISAEYRKHVPQAAVGLRYMAQVEELGTVEQTAEAVRHACRGCELLAVIIGAETGVTLGDAVSEELGLMTNGTATKRRNKNVQQQLVKARGLRAVREACGTRWEDVEAFVMSESMPVVVKPVEAAGSDGVKVCQSVEEAKEHFDVLMSAQKKVGGQNAAVLCQEFLKGREYVVDHVSRDGVHKTAMVWMYDKRAVNGAPFVYFGMVPIASDSEVARQLIPYVRGVLDAIGITHGPTHGEVIMTSDGPCLVEMNCRAQGGDGNWVPLAKALTGGYSQVDAGVDAYLEPAAFAALPDVPPTPFRAAGQEVMLVSYSTGLVLRRPGLDRICDLPSFVSMDSTVPVGTRLERSVDLFTSAGSVILMHQDQAILAEDVRTIRKMEADCTLFDLESEAEVAPALFAQLAALASPKRLRSCSEELLTLEAVPPMVGLSPMHTIVAEAY